MSGPVTVVMDMSGIRAYDEDGNEAEVPPLYLHCYHSGHSFALRGDDMECADCPYPNFPPKVYSHQEAVTADQIKASDGHLLLEMYSKALRSVVESGNAGGDMLDPNVIVKVIVETRAL